MGLIIIAIIVAFITLWASISAHKSANASEKSAKVSEESLRLAIQAIENEKINHGAVLINKGNWKDGMKIFLTIYHGYKNEASMRPVIKCLLGEQFPGSTEDQLIKILKDTKLL